MAPGDTTSAGRSWRHLAASLLYGAGALAFATLIALGPLLIRPVLAVAGVAAAPARPGRAALRRPCRRRVAPGGRGVGRRGARRLADRRHRRRDQQPSVIAELSASDCGADERADGRRESVAASTGRCPHSSPHTASCSSWLPADSGRTQRTGLRSSGTASRTSGPRPKTTPSHPSTPRSRTALLVLDALRNFPDTHVVVVAPTGGEWLRCTRRRHAGARLGGGRCHARCTALQDARPGRAGGDPRPSDRKSNMQVVGGRCLAHPV
jgi:hypothetical protein